MFFALLALGGAGTYARQSHDPDRPDARTYRRIRVWQRILGADRLQQQPAGELTYAKAMEKEKSVIFGKSSASLESLNPRGDDRMRASHICQ